MFSEDWSMTIAHITDTTTQAGRLWSAPEIVDGTPLTIAPAAQDGTPLTGIFVEADAGALEARAAAWGADVERVEIPAEPAARRDFLARWSAENALLRRGLPMALLLLPLAACGGGGGGGGGSSGASGVVIKGYLQGATVFRDVNRDGVFQSTGANAEPSATTNANGQFSGLGGSTNDPIIAVCLPTDNCRDVSTNAPFVGTMTAPGTATVITPLTTLVNALLPATGTPTQAQVDAAVLRVNQAMGLDETTALLSLDIGQATGGNSLNALKQSVQLGNIIAAVGGGQNGTEIVKEVAELLNANQAPNLADATTIQNLILNSGIQNIDAQSAQTIAQAIATQNATIADPNTTDPEDVEAAQPKIFTLAQASATGVTLPSGEYTIADTAANIQAALSATDEAGIARRNVLLADGAKIVVSDSVLVLTTATAAVFAEKIGGTGNNLQTAFDISDGIAAVDQLADLALATIQAARNITIAGGTGADQIGNPYAAGTRSVILDGGAGNDALEAFTNGDTLIGGAGNDVLQTDVAVATADYSYLGNSPLVVTVASTGTVTVTASASDVDTLIRIQNLTGGGGSDTLTGDSAANILAGGGGNDTLNGDTGNDTLSGGNGNDALSGGDGTDTADYSYLVSSPVTLNLESGTATAGLADIDTLSGIENAIGGGGADLLIGSVAANTLSGGTGDDTLRGGGGNDLLIGGGGGDTADYSYTSAGVTVAIDTASTVAVTVTAGSDVDALVQIANVIGGSGNDVLTGDSGANVLSGGSGSDTLTGGDGADVLTGGAGNDVLNGGAGTDRLIFSTTSALNGSDVVQSFSAADDRIDFQFGEADGLAQSALRGSGINYAEVAAGGTIGTNVGLVVITTAATELSTNQALVFADGLSATIAEQDVLFVVFSNGTNAGIYRVSDSDDLGTAFDSAELLVTLNGVTSASSLSATNFIDFQAT
jgi:Ca2+-binding RTX toxin-like protein